MEIQTLILEMLSCQLGFLEFRKKSIFFEVLQKFSVFECECLQLFQRLFSAGIRREEVNKKGTVLLAQVKQTDLPSFLCPVSPPSPRPSNSLLCSSSENLSAASPFFRDFGSQPPGWFCSLAQSRGIPPSPSGVCVLFSIQLIPHSGKKSFYKTPCSSS